jgi:hypothetical protein
LILFFNFIRHKRVIVLLSRVELNQLTGRGFEKKYKFNTMKNIVSKREMKKLKEKKIKKYEKNAY